jgi:hypothetical protein
VPRYACAPHATRAPRLVRVRVIVRVRVEVRARLRARIRVRVSTAPPLVLEAPRNESLAEGGRFITRAPCLGLERRH